MNYTKAQQDFIDATAPLVVALAGPGSGKTAALAERINRQLRADPSAVTTLACDMDRARRTVAITYTVAAAEVLKARIFPHELAYAGTLHGFMLKLLCSHGRLLGMFGGDIAVIADADRDALLDQLVIEEGYKGTVADLEAALRLGPWPYFQTSRGVSNAAYRVCFRLFQEMMRGNFLDYDSMLGFGLALIEKLKGWSELGSKTFPYEFLFVDEFQDASDTDGAIYRALPVKERTYIGDMDQAIYSFRGGSLKPFRQAIARAQTVTDRAEAVFYLEENWRCDAAICELANKLINHNAMRIATRTISATGRPGSVHHWQFRTALEEAVAIAKDLLCHVEHLQGLTVNGSAAVLVRTNDLADFYREALRQAGVRVAEKVHPAIPADWEAARLVLDLLICPRSDWLAVRYLTKVRGANAAQAAKDDANNLGVTVNEIAGLNLRPGLDLFEVLPRLGISKESIGLMHWVALKLAGGTLNELSLKAAEIATAYAMTEGVHVGTIHSAKGLEWGTVYLPAFEAGILPLGGQDEKEERRLAYVGMTRARHRLVISNAIWRVLAWQKEVTARNPSPFLAECGLGTIGE